MIEQCGTLEISRSRFLHNLQVLRARIGAEKKICATVKADAYGHGIQPLAGLLREAGIDWIAVYTFEEALTSLGISSQAVNILVLAPFVLANEQAFSARNLGRLFNKHSSHIRLNVTDLQSARFLSAAIVASGTTNKLNIHVQVDSGLTRAGADPREAIQLAEAIGALPGLYLEGFFSHLSHGDTPHHPSLQQQLSMFHAIAAPLKKRFPHLLLHVQNSGGTFNVDSATLDMVRIGIALYGLQPSVKDPIVGLLPVAQLTAPVLAIHERPAKTGVGYGHTFITKRQSRLAIVPMGYADGYPRQISNAKNAIVQVRGMDMPVVGRVSMDQIVVDITDIGGSEVQVGEKVTAISWDVGKENSLDAMAQSIGTIGYELATHLGSRIRRVIVD